jgi:hypothetical protein
MCSKILAQTSMMCSQMLAGLFQEGQQVRAIPTHVGKGASALSVPAKSINVAITRQHWALSAQAVVVLFVHGSPKDIHFSSLSLVARHKESLHCL